MSDVVIQAGHQNIEQNCDWGLRGQTGAPGERQYVSELAAVVCGALAAHGITATGADANFNCVGAAHNDHLAVVALHCDGRDRSGFAVGTGDPANDGAKDASANLRAALRTTITAETGLADLSPDFESDVNITQYYLFNALTPATPFVLIELGAIADARGNFGPDYQFLHSHKDAIAGAVVNGVLSFLAAPDTSVVHEATAADVDAEKLDQAEQAAIAASGGTRRTTSIGEDVATNLGQALRYADELAAHADPNVANTARAIASELHTARRLLNDE